MNWTMIGLDLGGLGWFRDFAKKFVSKVIGPLNIIQNR
jgi:hypothetical protein